MSSERMQKDMQKGGLRSICDHLNNDKMNFLQQMEWLVQCSD